MVEKGGQRLKLSHPILRSLLKRMGLRRAQANVRLRGHEEPQGWKRAGSGGKERDLFLALSLKKSHSLGLKGRPLVYMTFQCILSVISVVKGLFLFQGR